MSVMASMGGNKPVSMQNLGHSLSLLTQAWLLAAQCPSPEAGPHPVRHPLELARGLGHPLGLHNLHSAPTKWLPEGSSWPARVTEGLSQTPAAHAADIASNQP